METDEKDVSISLWSAPWNSYFPTNTPFTGIYNVFTKYLKGFIHPCIHSSFHHPPTQASFHPFTKLTTITLNTREGVALWCLLYTIHSCAMGEISSLKWFSWCSQSNTVWLNGRFPYRNAEWNALSYQPITHGLTLFPRYAAGALQ